MSLFISHNFKNPQMILPKIEIMRISQGSLSYPCIFQCLIPISESIDPAPRINGLFCPGGQEKIWTIFPGGAGRHGFTVLIIVLGLKVTFLVLDLLEYVDFGQKCLTSNFSFSVKTRSSFKIRFSHIKYMSKVC